MLQIINADNNESQTSVNAVDIENQTVSLDSFKMLFALGIKSSVCSDEYGQLVEQQNQDEGQNKDMYNILMGNISESKDEFKDYW